MSKKLILLTLVIISLASCITQEPLNKPLYSWGNYELTSYNYLKYSDEKSSQELIENYQKIIESQRGARRVAPPGICADYGFLLLQKGKKEQGKKMLLKEISLYPESKIFIERILKMIGG